MKNALRGATALLAVVGIAGAMVVGAQAIRGLPAQRLADDPCVVSPDGPPTCGSPTPTFQTDPPTCAWDPAAHDYAPTTPGGCVPQQPGPCSSLAPCSTPTSSSAGVGGSVPAPVIAANANLTGACALVYFQPYQMNLAVYALVGQQIVPGASASATVTGTDAKYPAVNQSFSGVTSAPSPSWTGGDPRAATFTASFPLVLPDTSAYANGNVTQPAASYRCHGTVTYSGQSASF